MWALSLLWDVMGQSTACGGSNACGRACACGDREPEIFDGVPYQKTSREDVEEPIDNFRRIQRSRSQDQLDRDTDEAPNVDRDTNEAPEALIVKIHPIVQCTPFSISSMQPLVLPPNLEFYKAPAIPLSSRIQTPARPHRCLRPQHRSSSFPRAVGLTEGVPREQSPFNHQHAGATSSRSPSRQQSSRSPSRQQSYILREASNGRAQRLLSAMPVQQVEQTFFDLPYAPKALAARTSRSGGVSSRHYCSPREFDYERKDFFLTAPHNGLKAEDGKVARFFVDRRQGPQGFEERSGQIARSSSAISLKSPDQVFRSNGASHRNESDPRDRLTMANPIADLRLNGACVDKTRVQVAPQNHHSADPLSNVKQANANVNADLQRE